MCRIDNESLAAEPRPGPCAFQVFQRAIARSTHRHTPVMVELFRAPDSAEADAIAETLRDLSIARSIITVRSEDDLPGHASFTVEDLPVLIDDGDVFTEPDAIVDHLEALEALMADWYRFQSDTCELDAEGNVC